MSSENELPKNEITQMALESVNTEQEANLLIEGKMLDALLVKASVLVEIRGGVMLFLFSLAKGELLQVYSVFGNSPLLNRISTFEGSEQFLKDLIEAVKAGGIERTFSDRIGRAMFKELDSQAVRAQFPKMAKKSFEGFCELTQEVINNELKIGTAKVQIDIERISSLNFRLRNPLAPIYAPINNPYKESNKNQVPTEVPGAQEKAKADSQISEIQKDYKHVLVCKTIVSPVAGVDFDSLKENMKLLFMLPFQTNEEKTLAKSLGAVTKEGVLKPIAGEFLKIITGGKNEYHIFAKGPNGMLLRAFEERPVKLAMSKKQANSARKEESSELGKMMSVIIGILLVLVIVLFFMYLA